MGIAIDQAMAERAVSAYRKGHPRVKALWDGLDRCFRSAVTGRESAQWRHCGFTLIRRADEVDLLLPSKRRLRYYHPSLEPGKYREDVWVDGRDPLTQQWSRAKTYGGKLTENAVQALARDILAHHLLAIVDEGYDVVAHTHDEIVVETSDPETTLARLESIMTTPPPWANGLPLAVSSYVCDRYRKD